MLLATASNAIIVGFQVRPTPGARKLAEETDSPYVREMTDFILGASDRNFLTPK